MNRSKTSIKAWPLALLFVFALAASLACVSAAHASTPQDSKGTTVTTQANSGALTAGEAAKPADDAKEDPREAPDPYTFGIGADIVNAKVTFTNGSVFAYTGKEIEPTFTATLTKNGQTRALKGTTNPNDETADFYYFYMNNVDVSLGKTLAIEDRPMVILATFVGQDPWVYTKEVPFTIKPAKMKAVTVKVANQTYTGKKLKPAVSAKFNGMTLQKGTDYTVKYKKNVKVGTAKAIIMGKGNFTGKKTVKFKIKKASIKNAKFSKVKDKVYTGRWIRPNVKVKYKGKVLKKNKDYTITYTRNKNAGIATIKIQGKGNMKGVQKIRFVIEPRSIYDLSQAYVNSVMWTGDFLKPDPVMKYKGTSLKEGRDYTVSYSDNVEPGWGHAYVTAQKNFTGSRIFTFQINKRTLDRYSGTPVSAWMRFDKYIYEPNLQPRPVVVYNGRKLYEYVDYTLSWDNSDYNSDTHTGIGHVTIYGCGSHYTGQRTLDYKMIGRAVA